MSYSCGHSLKIISSDTARILELNIRMHIIEIYWSLLRICIESTWYSGPVGQLPRVSTEDRVVSVFEPSVCLILACLSANFLIFPSFILLFLYSTVQKSAVQYSYLFIKLLLFCDYSLTYRGVHRITALRVKLCT